jgi:transposase-like protein
MSGEEKDRGFGLASVWRWAAIDADTKLIASWLVSSRDAGAAFEFAHDLASHIIGRVQITSDGHKAYATATSLASTTVWQANIRNSVSTAMP